MYNSELTFSNFL